MKVIKRDGRAVEYNSEKIRIAIGKANKEVSKDEKVSSRQIDNIIKYIEQLDKKRILVEDIQDIIEKKLMEQKKYELAKKYIIYRYTRALIRKQNTTDESILGLLRGNTDRENYKRVFQLSEKRSLIAKEVSKDISERVLIKENIVSSHNDGDIYFHNMDYFIDSAINTSLIDIEDMLSNGFNIKDVEYKEPENFIEAIFEVISILTEVSKNQYGTITIDINPLSKYLFKTYNYYKDIYIPLADESLMQGVKILLSFLNNIDSNDVFLYMNSDNKKYEEFMYKIIEAVLEEKTKNIYDNVKLIYVLNDKNIKDELTHKAINCLNKTGYPNLLSQKVMTEKYNQVFPPIGMQIFLPPIKENGKIINKGRFSQGIVSINLVRIAILNKYNIDGFYEMLEEKLEIAKEALMCKYFTIKGNTTLMSPIHFEEGAISRLSRGESIEKYLNKEYSCISLGYVGLKNTVDLLTKDEDKKSDIAINILKYIKNKCMEWEKETDISFVLSSPDEKTVNKYFSMKDKDKYGIIKGVNDKDYVKNCDFNIDLNDMELEHNFHMNVDGYISRVNLTTNEQENIDLIEKIYDKLLYIGKR